MNDEELQAMADFVNDPENTTVMEEPEVCPEAEQAKPDYHPTGEVKEIDTKGAINVVTAIIERAIEDYRGLEAAGIIKSGRIVGHFKPRQRILDMGYKDAADVIAYLESEALDEDIDLAHLEIDPEMIREQLHVEKSLRHRLNLL